MLSSYVLDSIASWKYFSIRVGLQWPDIASELVQVSLQSTALCCVDRFIHSFEHTSSELAHASLYVPLQTNL